MQVQAAIGANASPAIRAQVQRLKRVETIDKALLALLKKVQQETRDFRALLDDGLTLCLKLEKTLAKKHEEVCRWLQSEKQQQPSWRHLRTQQCPVVSAAVTMLVDYFWQWRSHYQPARLYRFVGEYHHACYYPSLSDLRQETHV